MSNSYIGQDDLITNTASRLAVCLCLDTSGSMVKDGAIDALNDGVKVFYQAIRDDEQASASCEIAVVTFDSEVKVVEEFSTIDKKEDVKLTAQGGTALAHAVEKALDLLEARKDEYKANGVEYYQPWLVIITDGKPGDMEDVPAAQARAKKLCEEKRLVVYSLVVGNDSDPVKWQSITDILNGFSTKVAIHLKDLKFDEFFEWLGKSTSAVSASQVGETVKLDTTGMDNWGEI